MVIMMWIMIIVTIIKIKYNRPNWYHNNQINQMFLLIITFVYLQTLMTEIFIFHNTNYCYCTHIPKNTRIECSKTKEKERKNTYKWMSFFIFTFKNSFAWTLLPYLQELIKFFSYLSVCVWEKTRGKNVLQIKRKKKTFTKQTFKETDTQYSLQNPFRSTTKQDKLFPLILHNHRIT